jgi:hypothetical protein
MTFLERYNSETTWHGKVMVMEIYHLAMSTRSKNWTITKTAEHFQCSIGLVSENLKLAHALHTNHDLFSSLTRQDALKRLNGKMAKIWQQQPFEVLQQWIDDILEEASDELNDWETKFIDDMRIRVVNKWPLTQTQEEKLESIYADKTS